MWKPADPARLTHLLNSCSTSAGGMT